MTEEVNFFTCSKLRLMKSNYQMNTTNKQTPGFPKQKSDVHVIKNKMGNQGKSILKEVITEMHRAENKTKRKTFVEKIASTYNRVLYSIKKKL